MKNKPTDWGSPLLIVVFIVTLLLFCIGKSAVLYDGEQTLALTSCGTYDDGIFEYDTLEFYAISTEYKSEFLQVPDKYENFTVDSVHTAAFYGTPVRYVLLPESIKKLTNRGTPDVIMFTDNEELSALCQEYGFQTDSTAAYYKLLKEADKFPFSPANIVSNFTVLAGTPWIIAVALALFGIVLLSARLRENAGYENPLAILKKPGSLTNTAFILVQVAAAFITFYFLLYETEEIGLDTEWVMDALTNWPLKISIVLFALVLISDIFNKNFFPWYFARVYIRIVRLLIPMGIAAALGSLVGMLSTQFRFIVHLIAAAPVPLFFFVVGGLACFIFAKLGIYQPGKNNGASSGSSSDGSSGSDDSNSTPRRSGGTTTLIAPDGTSYPVHNVGYGYMVNNKMLRNFDPHGTENPVDEDGTVYTRY